MGGEGWGSRLMRQPALSSEPRSRSEPKNEGNFWFKRIL